MIVLIKNHKSLRNLYIKSANKLYIALLIHNEALYFHHNSRAFHVKTLEMVRNVQKSFLENVRMNVFAGVRAYVCGFEKFRPVVGFSIIPVGIYLQINIL